MNVMYLAVGFLVLAALLAALLNGKGGKKGKRRHRRDKPERGEGAKGIPEEMKPYIKRLGEAKTRDEKLMAIMDLRGKFGKDYPELAEIWAKRGERILEREKDE